MLMNFDTLPIGLFFLATVASLDRPRSGYITVSQQPLIDLRDSMTPKARDGLLFPK
jgi:hypothetical protein